jgi:hypothetical protein
MASTLRSFETPVVSQAGETYSARACNHRERTVYGKVGSSLKGQVATCRDRAAKRPSPI